MILELKTLLDIGNACFEAGGAYSGWMNVRQLYRDKQVKGVLWKSTAFFAAWGYWNVFYYPAVNQPLSGMAGAVLAFANTAWVLMALKYMKKVQING